ncbi:hypothetical protein SAMN05444280_11314 [Tangfeifania diversioriginum]|uniref:Uncharacterized protein n=1 Tax=Tangfeifania diversioriginum TaxID=1168035 RepID=A0A1M6HAK1_9BACT|nr:hypothetical protein [Tangfeifania diversioriginum]SHJ19267.1 hypothetical protein SAMN05444280_11314 [Tangfeifania diversioriginum]
MKKILSLSLIFMITLGINSCKKENENEPERVYTKTIERNFSNDFEKDLIEKAETFSGMGTVLQTGVRHVDK